MSRNKQIDRLSVGLEKHANRLGMSMDKIDDPVAFVFELLKERQEEVDKLELEKEETNELFGALHDELVHAGCSAGLIINREDNTPITLGELGFSRLNDSVDILEDKARLITIVGMVIKHLRDLVLKEQKISGVRKRDLHNTLMELGLWQDTLPGSYQDMLTRFFDSYEKLEKDREQIDIFAKSLNDILLSHKEELRRGKVESVYNCKIIKNMTEELRYQYKRY